MRSQLLEVMNQDYIRTAKAKGLSRSGHHLHHALKNALIPVVTYIGIDFGAHALRRHPHRDGLQLAGRGLWRSTAPITERDWPIVLGGVTVIVIVVMVINLLVDISYAFLDPRIRYGAPKEGREGMMRTQVAGSRRPCRSSPATFVRRPQALARGGRRQRQASSHAHPVGRRLDAPAQEQARHDRRRLDHLRGPRGVTADLWAPQLLGSPTAH